MITCSFCMAHNGEHLNACPVKSEGGVDLWRAGHAEGVAIVSPTSREAPFILGWFIGASQERSRLITTSAEIQQRLDRSALYMTQSFVPVSYMVFENQNQASQKRRNVDNKKRRKKLKIK